MSPEELKAVIEAAFSNGYVEVSGDGRHFSAIVVSESFTGKNPIAQHRMVYSALGDRFDTEVVHALSLKTYTPEQWQALKG